MTEKDQFLYVRSSYQGEVHPENLVFDANLQEFSQRIGYVCALETGGKITSEEDYQQIKTLWDELSRTRQSLGIGTDPFQGERPNTDHP